MGEDRRVGKTLRRYVEMIIKTGNFIAGTVNVTTHHYLSIVMKLRCS